MNPILRDYLYFTKSQRKALIIISVLIGLLILFNQYAHMIFQDEIDFEVEYLEAKYQGLQEKSSSKFSVKDNIKDKRKNEKTLFPFNPNQISLSEWISLGLSEDQARSIIKYRDKGGRFRIRSDLKKMYVISEEQYSEWESYIQLPDQLKRSKSQESFKEQNVRKKEMILVDLNTADSASLTRVRGIGPVYASRIVKFRKAAGGFYSLDQLTDVWGISDSVLQGFRPQLKLGEAEIRSIMINQIEAAELKTHPYLNWQYANAIVNYRKQHGPYKGVDDLRQLYLLSDSLISKFAPYLEFD